MKFSETRRKLLRNIYQGLGVAVVSTTFQACSTTSMLSMFRNSAGPAYGQPGPMYGPQPMYGTPGPIPAYGVLPVNPTPTTDVMIHGTVFSEKTEAPIAGIKVSVKDLPVHAYTDNDGHFDVYVPGQDSYKLKFEDVDGLEEGPFQMQKKEITLREARSPLYIYLSDEEDDEE